MQRMTYQEAVVAAIQEEMRRDETVFHLGQDIGEAFNGPLQSCRGLAAEFGPGGRIIETPISESAMVGACVGAALNGMRPIVQIMFAEFLGLVMQQIACDAAAMHYKSDGKVRVPLVVRALYGVGPHRGHAEDYHSWMVNVPGVKVVLPATAHDAKGLMKSAIRDDNPVVFLEHMSLYHASREEIPDEDYTIPLGRADIKRQGTDVTIVATALTVHQALEAAEKLSQAGTEAEVIDLRTVAPLDEEAILNSVAKTGRLVVTHETWKTGGSGAEVSALVAEEGFDGLKAPIARVAPPHMPIPYGLPLEREFMPNAAKIEQAVKRLMEN